MKHREIIDKTKKNNTYLKNKLKKRFIDYI